MQNTLIPLSGQQIQPFLLAERDTKLVDAGYIHGTEIVLSRLSEWAGWLKATSVVSSPKACAHRLGPDTAKLQVIEPTPLRGIPI